MKADDAVSLRRQSLPAGRPGIVLFLLTALTFWSTGAAGSMSEDPYAGLTRRNSFGLISPAPAINVPRQEGGLPNVELKGITTILGRPQAILTMTGLPNMPGASADRSFILETGQQENGIKIEDINCDAGVVRLEAQGVEISLRLLDYTPNPVEEPVLPIAAGQPSIADRPVNRGSDAIAPALAAPPRL